MEQRKGEDRGGDKSTQNDDGIGYSISWPGMLPEMIKGMRASPVVSTVIMIGTLEVLVTADEHDSVSSDDSDGEEADQRTKRDTAAEIGG